MTGKSEKSGSKIAEDFKDTTQGMMRLRPDEVYIERQRAKEVKAAEEQIALHESQVIVRGRSGVRILKPLPLTAVNSLTYELSRGFIRRYATTNASIYVPLKPLEVLEAVLATHYVFRYGERDVINANDMSNYAAQAIGIVQAGNIAPPCATIFTNIDDLLESPELQTQRRLRKLTRKQAKQGVQYILEQTAPVELGNTNSLQNRTVPKEFLYLFR